ncbi:reverse transcriptase domain-containing protein [Enterobacter hormaechei]|nr:reverse transcriptase domain-containing protein [Enterobacter hormaechei]
MFSKFEPRNVKDALDNESWIEEMNEEIDRIESKKTWTLVPRPKDKNLFGTKWVFKDKLNENGEVSRNKVRLVCKGYVQEEGIDYGENFALVARLEGVRTLLTYATHKGFKGY